MATNLRAVPHNQTSLLPTLKTTSVFENWKFRISLFLEEKGINEILHVKVKYKRKNEDLKKKDAAARLWIVESVDDELLNVIMKCKTAREMIKKLEARFRRKTSFTKYDLKKKLLTMKFKPSDNLQTHFQQFDELISDLESIGCKLQASDKVCHLLLTLPDEYKNIIASLDNILSLSESENIVKFVKNYFLNSVRANEKTNSNIETEGSPLVTFNMEDETVKVDSETIEQYQINENKEIVNSDVDADEFEHVSLDDITASVCTVQCSPEALEAGELDQCPDSCEIISSDLDLIDEVPKSSADEEVDPLSDSLNSHAYCTERRDLFDDNNLEANVAEPEPFVSAADCYPDATSAHLAKELKPNELGGDLCPQTFGLEQDSESEQELEKECGLLRPDCPVILKEESSEDMCTSDMLCCKVVLQDAADRLWCAYCDHWCLSEMELQRHKQMHVTTQTHAVDKASHSISEKQTIRKRVLFSNEVIISPPTTSLEQQTNSQTATVANLPSNQSSILQLSPKATVANIVFNQSSVSRFNPHDTVAFITSNQPSISYINPQDTVVNIAFNQFSTSHIHPQDTVAKIAYNQSSTSHINPQDAVANIASNQSSTSHINPQDTVANIINQPSISNINPQDTVANIASNQSSTSHIIPQDTVANIASNQFSTSHIIPQDTVANIASNQSSTSNIIPQDTVANIASNQCSTSHIIPKDTVANIASNQCSTSHIIPKDTVANIASNQSSNSYINPQEQDAVAKSTFDQSPPIFSELVIFMEKSVKNKCLASRTCTICNKTFKFPWSLKKHAVVHTGEKPFSCDICKKCYTVRHSLNIHIKRAHTDYIEPRPFSCDICSKTFSLKKNLIRHADIHNEDKFECNICHRWFKSKVYLTKHIPVHNRERPLNCDVCNKSFRAKRLLKAHKIIHSENKIQHICHVCGKSFLRVASLHKHKSIHEDACYGTRQFICNDCGKVFNKKSNLIIHIALHRSDRPFKCKVCKKSFVLKWQLKRHKLTHGERKYSCNVCGQRFFHTSTLNRHMKAPHSAIAGPRRDRPPRK